MKKRVLKQACYRINYKDTPPNEFSFYIQYPWNETPKLEIKNRFRWVREVTPRKVYYRLMLGGVAGEWSAIDLPDAQVVLRYGKVRDEIEIPGARPGNMFEIMFSQAYSNLITDVQFNFLKGKS